MVYKMASKDIKKDKKSNVKSEKIQEPNKTEATTPEVKINLPITSTTKLIRCDCKHEFQDKTYGYGMRVHTPTKSGSNRCTVCNKIK